VRWGAAPTGRGAVSIHTLNHECSAYRLRYLVRLRLIGFAKGFLGSANRRRRKQT